MKHDKNLFFFSLSCSQPSKHLVSSLSHLDQSNPYSYIVEHMFLIISLLPREKKSSFQHKSIPWFHTWNILSKFGTLHSPAEPALSARSTVPLLPSSQQRSLSPASWVNVIPDQRGSLISDALWRTQPAGVGFSQAFISRRVAGSVFKSAWLSELSRGTGSPLYTRAMIPGERKREGGRESHSPCCVVHPFLYLCFLAQMWLHVYRKPVFSLNEANWDKMQVLLT